MRHIFRYSLSEIIKFLFYELRSSYRKLIYKSFSHNLEDLIVHKHLNFISKGVYIDIGAHVNKRFNNTYRLYKYYDWVGHNLEPNPQLFRQIENSRENDKYHNIGITDKNDIMDFFIFSPDTLSTFSKEMSLIYKKKFKLISTIQVKTNTLSQFIKNNKILHCDFLNIDTEGYELQILKSNDWNFFSPKIICIEHSGYGQKNNTEEISDFLILRDYKLIHKNDTNFIFQKN